MNKKRLVLQSIVINIITVLVFNLIFLVQSNVDDVWQWYYINGAYSGKSAYYLLFGNEALGRFLQFMADTFPHVQWYNWFQYLISFVAMVIFVYILLQYEFKAVKYLMITLFMILAGYELYVAMVFTKTSGIVGAIAMFGLISDKLGWKGKALCIVEFVLSVMLRYKFGLMLILVYAGFAVAKLAWNFFIKEDTFQEMLKKMLPVVVLISLAGIFYVVTYYGPWNSHGPEWDDFKQRQRFRSAIWDYGYIYNDYEEHQDEYQALGITKEEAHLWYTENMDMFFPQDDVMKEAIAISKGKEAGILQYLSLKKFREFLAEVPAQLITEDCCFMLIVGIFLLLMTLKDHRHAWYASALGLIVLGGLNYYTFIQARAITHRVDVGLFTVAFLGMLHLAEDAAVKEELQMRSVVLPFTLFLLIVPYNYGKREYWNYADSERTKLTQDNKIFYDIATKDTAHAYLQLVEYHMAGREYYDLFVTNHAFVNVEKGYYSNIFLTIQTPYQIEHLKEYGVNDFLADIVNNDNTYLLIPDSDKMHDLALHYLSDRRGEEVELHLVKHLVNKNIYRVATKDYDPLTEAKLILGEEFASEENLASEEKYTSQERAEVQMIQGSCQVQIREEKNQILVNGDAVIPGTELFSQNAYLCVVDAQSQKQESFYLFEDMKVEDGDLSLKLSATLALPDYFDQEDQIYLVLENNGMYKCQKVEWTEYE